jgi:hypothetical protein
MYASSERALNCGRCRSAPCRKCTWTGEYDRFVQVRVPVTPIAPNERPW